MNQTSTPCKNQFLEDDGYCTQCGKNHFQVQERNIRTRNAKAFQPAQKVDRQAIKAQQIEGAINANPNYRTARDIVKTIAELYEIKIKIVFRNRERGSYCLSTPNGEYTVVFGYQALNWFAENGYLSNLAHDRSNTLNRFGDYPTELDAIRLHAIHETTHAVVHHLGYRDEHHGPNFYRVFNELVDLAF